MRLWGIDWDANEPGSATPETAKCTYDLQSIRGVLYLFSNGVGLLLTGVEWVRNINKPCSGTFLMVSITGPRRTIAGFFFRLVVLFWVSGSLYYGTYGSGAETGKRNLREYDVQFYKRPKQISAY